MSRTPKVAVELRTYHERTRELERLKLEQNNLTPPTIKENEIIQNFTTPKTTVSTSSRFSLVHTGSIRSKIQEWNAAISKERRSSLSSETSGPSSPAPETPPSFRRAGSYRSLTRDIADLIPKRHVKKEEWWKEKTTPTSGLSRNSSTASDFGRIKQQNRISRLVQDFEFPALPVTPGNTPNSSSRNSIDSEFATSEKDKLIDSLPESSVDKKSEEVPTVVLRRNKNVKGKKYNYRKSDGNYCFLQSLGPKPYIPPRRSLDGSNFPTLV